MEIKMDKNRLYQEKGDLVTNIEILQARLSEINKSIIDLLNQESRLKKEQENGEKTNG